MCYCVYIGANTALSLVTLDQANQTFSLEAVAGWDTTVAQHFSKRNIYHAGSWQGCSCGFAADVDPENAELVAQNLRSIQALLSCIRAALEQEDTIEFYTCWAGNQWQAPQERRTVGMDLLSVDPMQFELEEDVFLTFTSQ